jgi:hypothetical protein
MTGIEKSKYKLKIIKLGLLIELPEYSFLMISVYHQKAISY